MKIKKLLTLIVQKIVNIQPGLALFLIAVAIVLAAVILKWSESRTGLAF